MIDEDTEEVLVRPYIRRDRNRLSMPNTAKGMCRAYAATGSKKIREVIVHEVKKAYARTPEMKGFTSENSRADLLDLMSQPSNPIEYFVDIDGMGSNVDQIGIETPSSNVGEISKGSHHGEIDNRSPLRKTVDVKHKRSSQGHSEGQSSTEIPTDGTETSSVDFSLISPEDAGPSLDDLFNEFWSHWPKKVKKPEAHAAFMKAVKDKRATAKRIITGAKAYAAADLPDKKFIPNPATWLNNDQWNDDPNDSISGSESASPGREPAVVRTDPWGRGSGFYRRAYDWPITTDYRERDLQPPKEEFLVWPGNPATTEDIANDKLVYHHGGDPADRPRG
ncbi:hypothetical protein [Nesterenkonia haasae]|uniref:hypothetical protein n=1 Tax=Nesterenkonia haasae TaxID=2587813 RepID=UPI001F305CB3|nr:hypothetical protein [Nesterenkonia haasae]NDK31196.1 hypothetical protein [Nesterenkonia haasae]